MSVYVHPFCERIVSTPLVSEYLRNGVLVVLLYTYEASVSTKCRKFSKIISSFVYRRNAWCMINFGH